MIKKFLSHLFDSAMALNRQNILSSIVPLKEGKLLDVGCNDGNWTIALGKKMQTDQLYGIEIVDREAKKAQGLGIQVKTGDIVNGLPYDNDEFDLVHANQIIEHVSDVDLFAREIYRVLKPGGLLILSTENASSWHNIFALVLGWQMFSLSNMSDLQLGVGNPCALHRNEHGHQKSWTHKVIFSYLGLKEFLELHRFKNISVLGAGYYPLPSNIGKLDKRHAHFLTIVAKK